MGICKCSIIGPPPPPRAQCNSYCIYAPGLLVDNQVTACDEETDIDISPIVAVCGDTTPKYSIVSVKNAENVSITSEKITFTPVNNDYAAAEIVYKVACGMLSDVGKVVIVYKSNCWDVTCAAGTSCNKCTGDCDDLPGNLSTDGNIGGVLGGLTLI